MMQVQAQIEMKIIGCYNGHVYAVPISCPPICPFCTSDDLNKLSHEIDTLKSTISGLRGEITKLKRRRNDGND